MSSSERSGSGSLLAHWFQRDNRQSEVSLPVKPEARDLKGERFEEIQHLLKGVTDGRVVAVLLEDIPYSMRSVLSPWLQPRDWDIVRQRKLESPDKSPVLATWNRFWNDEVLIPDAKFGQELPFDSKRYRKFLELGATLVERSHLFEAVEVVAPQVKFDLQARSLQFAQYEPNPEGRPAGAFTTYDLLLEALFWLKTGQFRSAEKSKHPALQLLCAHLTALQQRLKQQTGIDVFKKNPVLQRDVTAYNWASLRPPEVLGSTNESELWRQWQEDWAYLLTQKIEVPSEDQIEGEVEPRPVLPVNLALKEKMTEHVAALLGSAPSVDITLESGEVWSLVRSDRSDNLFGVECFPKDLIKNVPPDEGKDSGRLVVIALARQVAARAVDEIEKEVRLFEQRQSRKERVKASQAGNRQALLRSLRGETK